jgi:hypothetical protein
LQKFDEVLKVPENNSVIYFASQITLKYVYKVIRAIYPELFEKSTSLSKRVLIQTDSVLDSGFLKNRFSGQDIECARIIFAGDSIDEKYYGINNATHVFNYEYPTTPAELERRYLRTGASNLRPDEFIVFSDRELKYDGRILSKVMMSKLPMCFKKKIPSRNVLFWIKDAHKYIAEALVDLIFISENASGVNSDFIERFRNDYNIVEWSFLPSAAKARESAGQTFDKLIRLLGINEGELHHDGGIDKDMVADIVKECIAEIRGGYLYYNDDMEPRIIQNTNTPDEIARQYERDDFIRGMQAAVNYLDGALEKISSGDNECAYPFIRNIVDEFTDGLKFPVLYNVWKYCKSKGATASLEDFMDLYNRGVI